MSNTFDSDDKSQEKPQEAAGKTPEPSTELTSFIRAALVPTLIIKALLLFFGLNYSAHPGEGYGWGLVACLVASGFLFGRFLIRNS